MAHFEFLQEQPNRWPICSSTCYSSWQSSCLFSGYVESETEKVNRLQACGKYRDAGLDLKQIPTQYREFTEVQRIIWEKTTQYLTKGKTAKGAIADVWERVYALMKEAGHF